MSERSEGLKRESAEIDKVLKKQKEKIERMILDDYTEKIERIKKLEDAVRSALSIKELWLYHGHVTEEHKGESTALTAMLRKFEDVMK